MYFLHQVPKLELKMFLNIISDISKENENLNLNFATLKGFLILTEFGKLGKFASSVGICKKKKLPFQIIPL